MIIIALIRKFVRLKPPPRLTVRVYIWAIRTFIVELAPYIAVGVVLGMGALIALGGWEVPVLQVLIGMLGLYLLTLLYLSWQAVRSAATVRSVLDDLEDVEGREGPKFPLSHVLFPPLMLWSRGVRHERGVEYSRPNGRPLRLDVYLPKEAPEDGVLRPAVIQVHGGGWIVGTRLEQGIPLLTHLSSHGWVGFNIDYRLSPGATFPDHLVDVKAAIAWVREHAADYAIDPDFICITGGSAGGHLTALAALTANDPAYQPGFEQADTSVAAAVPFYAIYDVSSDDGLYYRELADWIVGEIVLKASRAEAPERFVEFSPTRQVHPGAPPFLVVHGEWDSLVPVEDARRFVERLRAVSSNPVLYAELAGAEHAFDLTPTVRTARVVETIERFLAEIRVDRQTQNQPHAATATVS